MVLHHSPDGYVNKHRGTNKSRKSSSPVESSRTIVEPATLSSKVDIQPIVNDLMGNLSSVLSDPTHAGFLTSFEDLLKVQLSTLVDKTVQVCYDGLSEQFSLTLDVDRQNQRSLNVCLRGLPEEITKNTNPHEREIELESAVVNVINNQVKPTTPIDSSHIVRVRRVGKFDVPKGSSVARPRPVIVTFVKHTSRMDLMRNKKNLKGSGLMITEDLTPMRRKILHAAFERFSPKQVWSANGIIKFNHKGKIYSSSSMKEFEDVTSNLP
uniref:Uncharacterized protein n=1 Tax=Lygus hesperus TaxID=30085 RepID=A0A0A9XWU1_LYGHE